MPSITCWRQGVAPTSWPAFRSCRLSPATAAAHADHRADHDRRDRTDGRTLAHDREQQQRGEQDGRDRDAGDRVVRGADQAGHVAADRGKHEARDHHDDGHRERDAEAVDDRVIEREQRQHEEHDADQDRASSAGPARCAARRPCEPAFMLHAGLDAGEQRFPQRPQRPEPADQHRADADVADLAGSRSGRRRPPRRARRAAPPAPGSGRS